MPAPPINYGEASIWFRLAGDPEEMAVTTGFHDEFAVPASADELAETIYGCFVGTGMIFTNTAVSSTYSAVRCDVRITREAEDLIQQGSYSQSTAGTRSSSTLPSNCSMFVRKNSGFVGRRQKGRMYFPAGFLVADNVSPTGQIEAGSALPTLQTRMTATYDAMVTAEVPPVILHTTSPFTPTPVTSFVVQPVIATQRRRLRP